MAMKLPNILGFGAHEPLVDLEADNEIGAVARRPASISAAPPPASSTSLPWQSFATDTILGLAPDEGRNFRRSLAGGLNAAAANDDKPAMAAATASFGGALGGTSQDLKVALLDRAIRAHRTGDMDEVQRALTELLQAQRASQAGRYPGDMPNAGVMAAASAPTWRYDNILGIPLIGTGDRQPVANDRAPDWPQAPDVSSQPAERAAGWVEPFARPNNDMASERWVSQQLDPTYDSSYRTSLLSENILGMPLIDPGDRQPVPNDRALDRPQAPRAASAPPAAGSEGDHDAILDQALRAAGVPTHRLEPHHLVGAATLMAKQGLTPADAYERFVMQSVRDGGLIDPAGWQDLYGFGAGGGVQPASTPQDERPEQGDLKDWPPRQAPTNQGRETGPFDSGAFAPAAMQLQDLYGFDRGNGVQRVSAQQDEAPEPPDPRRWSSHQPATNGGWETGPSDSQLPVSRRLAVEQTPSPAQNFAGADRPWGATDIAAADQAEEAQERLAERGRPPPFQPQLQLQQRLQRLNAATREAETRIKEVQSFLPTWQPSPPAPGIDTILHAENRKREAEQRLREILPEQPLLRQLFPRGGAREQIDRLIALARDPHQGEKLGLHEMATAVRLERQLGVTMSRSKEPGTDFQDNLGRTWDAIGSEVTDPIFDLEQFTGRIESKLETRLPIGLPWTCLGSAGKMPHEPLISFPDWLPWNKRVS